jgi:autotransporter-associated beta strand protein
MLAGLAVQTAMAGDVVKADNTTDLNLDASWLLGTAPTAGDVAVWNSTVTGANSTLLGADLSWGGIRVADPAGAITIQAGNTLTLGKSGIDLSAATQDLTIGADLALLGNATQTWSVASGHTLDIAGALTKAAGAALNIDTSGGGTVKISSGTASTVLSAYATLNGGSDFAALDASNNVVSASTVTTYTDNPNTGASLPSTSGNVTVMNVVNSNTNGISAYRLSGNLTVGNGVLFNTAHTNAQDWVVDLNSRTQYMSDESGITVGSNVTTNVIFNGGTGTIRTNTSGNDDLYLVNNGSGDLIFNATFSEASGRQWTMTKSGASKVIFTSSSNGITNGIYVNEGTVQVGNGGTTGAVGSGEVRVASGANLEFNRTDTPSYANLISGAGSVTQSGSGTLTLTNANTYTGATYFKAGTVAFNAATDLGNGGALNFDGGALKYGGAHTTDISSRTVTMAAGGGTIDTNGNNITFANSIGNSGTGGLIKAGSGSLTLNGTSYTGTSTVNAGTLVANGAIAGGAAVNSGGILGGTGTFAGTITVNSAGILAPGNSVGTITTAGLTLATGSILNFEFNTTPANDFIAVTTSGGLTLNGGGFNLYDEGTTNAFSTVGTYNLIGYSGAIGGTGTGALSVLNPQAGKSYAFGSTGSNVTLDITAAGVISNWNVDADGSWNTPGNWTSTVPNGTGETAIFNKALTAARTVTLDGAKTLGGLSFDGGTSPLGYTIAQGSGGSLALDNGASQVSVVVTSGANVISANVSLDSTAVIATAAGASLSISGSVGGTSGLVKSGNGLLDLTNPSNGYSGDTSISGGTLGFAALGSLGSGALNFDGGTLRYDGGNAADISGKVVTIGSGGATIDTNGNDVTYAGAIGNGGLGGLTKTGTGTLTLQGSNTQTGATAITGGVLSISSNDNLGDAATGAGLTLNGGTLNTSADLALDNAGANSRAVTIGASGGTFSTDIATTLTVSGAVTGSAALTKSGAGTLVLSADNSTTLSSAISVTGGTLQAGGAQANGQLGFGTGAIALGDGTTLSANGAGANDNGTSYGNLVNAISITTGNTATLAPAKRMAISSALTGDGTLNVAVDGVRQDYQGDWGAFTGNINLTGAGEFRIAGFQSHVFDNSKLNIGAGVIVYQTFNPPSGTGTQTVQNIGELSGAVGSTLGGNPVGGRFVNWTVGSLNTDSTFSGVIQDSAGAARLTKVGTGTLTLDGGNTFTGGTTISAGKLAAANASALGIGDVTVDGGTLQGTVASVDIGGNLTLSNGTLDLRDTGAGAFSLASDKSFSMAGGTWLLNITDASTFDSITSLGGTVNFFTVGGTLDLTGSSLVAGSYNILAGFTSGSGDFVAITGYDTEAFSVTFDTSVAGTGTLNIAAVPEPQVYGLVMAGLFFSLFAYRRRRVRAA